uniref:Internal scaffolding protein n=1 Tax=Dulem virus 188 TaxID=3145665 RepID=A0AAU8B622_9VIRU
MVYDVVLFCDDRSKVIGTYRTARKANEVWDIVEKVRPEFGSVQIFCRKEFPNE